MHKTDAKINLGKKKYKNLGRKKLRDGFRKIFVVIRKMLLFITQF